MNILKLSLRMLRRDWRSGELYALALALVVAVGGVTSVGFFIDRVGQVLSRQASQLLGADLVVASDHPLRTEFEAEARRRGLATATVMSFPSMVVGNRRSQLAEIKAVGPGYPLRGRLRIADVTQEAERAASGIPAPGTVWPEARLLNQLGLGAGGELELGQARLSVGAVLVHEPDRGGGLFSIAPRLLVNVADIPLTALEQPGSRIGYRLLLAGEAKAVSGYRAWAEKRVRRGERLEGVSDARPEIRAALERAGQFLGLAALSSVVLAAVAIVLAARRFLDRHLDGCAVMRCLGGTQSLIFRVYLYQFLTLGLTASLVGCLLGYGAQWVLADRLGALVAADLPLPSLLPVVQGVLTGMTTLLGFALPFLLRLKQVPTLRVLRRELGVPRQVSLASFAAGFAALSALLLWQAGELRLGLYVLAGLIAATAVAMLLALGLIRALAPLRRRVGAAWRFGLANIARRPGASAGQVVALGLGLMVLLLLTLVRGDLMASWQSTLPEHAPNRFVINIQPDQLQTLREFFADRQLPDAELFPMVRGRLTAINGRPVSAADYPDERAKRLVEREFNLSWASRPQSDNRIVAGRWWTTADHGKALLSVEQGIAQTLGLKIGDTLAYQVADAVFAARVVSLRKVDWDSFHVNFFVIAPPGLLENFPASWITSFYLPPGRESVLDEMVRAYPNLTVIDVAALMAQVRSIMERVAQAVEFVFLFTLGAGLMALYAAIAATREERIYEAAILRTLGASRRQLVLGQLAEFAGIGLLAGMTAALGANVLSYVLSVQLLHLPYTFNPWLWLAAVIGGGAGVAAAGWLGARGVLRHPPLETLRSLS
ncbi:MAG: FtsX-like permease family protein [Pseudomonadota bacterium]